MVFFFLIISVSQYLTILFFMKESFYGHLYIAVDGHEIT